ncbi:U3 small nucleolar RNA-associated protein 14 homolog A [Topomyia yanbarensis]|uniref:U3 small nucleolar RNA-associated protein 14 homolog A n=1 Tax=Topomyia yanbarensis TaxID=2498891 RepID=UPI00273BD359|nr:U3 small nucleolar RNA-associated protein 14 homolog A [Topomyia yanbarensis]
MMSVQDPPNMSGFDEDHQDSAAHRKLLAGINSLVRTQDIPKVLRTEPSLQKSEFHLVKGRVDEDGREIGHHNIAVGDLLGILKKTAQHTKLGKELSQIVKKKGKTLPKPLEKPVADRIARDTLYGRTQKELNLWDAVVTAGEVAPQTVFPLQYGKVDVIDRAPQKLSQCRVKSDLMKAMEELDKKYQNPESEDEVQENTYALTLEEMRQKRKDAARQKMRELYKISKGRRMNKIKSKKYHKLLKRDKVRSQIKQFEELQKTDPEAALKQLEAIEKHRYKERVTLRHKNTGTWAKNMQIRAKYDMNVRQELSEQLSIGKELMGKRMVEEDESSESGQEDVIEEDDRDGNPWVRKAAGPHEEEANREFTSGYRKYWQERNEAQEKLKRLREGGSGDDVGESVDESEKEASESDSEDERQLEMFKSKVKKSKAISTSDWVEEDITPPVVASKKKGTHHKINVEEIFNDADELLQRQVEKKLANVRELLKSESRNPQTARRNIRNKDKSSSLAFKKKATLADADIELDESVGKGANPVDKAKITQTFHDPPVVSSTAIIDPQNFVKMKPKHLLNAIPDLSTAGDGLSDDEDVRLKQKLTIAEAFEDDDIVVDFERDKQEEQDRSQPKAVDLFLPGWGSWVGPGIDQNKIRKNRRKLFKPVPKLPRRDDNKERVIVNEDGVSKKLTTHLVNELPFPFVTVKDYEASLRAPVGRTFIPETAHSTLVEPRVVTKIGAVIEPIKKSILLQDPAASFKVGGKLFNKAVQKYEEFLAKDELEA